MTFPKGSPSPDVIVVGLGAAGAACLYQLARRGVRALGIDRFSPPHAMGSSHGETRITRQAIGEGTVYAPLAIRSHQIWRELEAASGVQLMLTCGVLTIAPGDGGLFHGSADFLGRSAAAGAAHGVAFERLSAGEVSARWPQFRLTGDEVALVEPGGGIVFPERCIGVQLDEARRLGAQVLCDTPALSIECGPVARVNTRVGVFEAGAVVATVGAWTPGLIGGAFARLAVQPQTLHWYACADPLAWAPARCPAFMWMHGPGVDDVVYGFPAVDGAAGGVKVGSERQAVIASAEDYDRTPAAGVGEADWARHVQGRLIGIGPGVLRSARCLYTTAPDSDFVIGWTGEGVLAASACSGHGFKHSAAIGEMLAAAVTDGEAPLPAFAPGRLG